jgi:uncharacterized protein
LAGTKIGGLRAAETNKKKYGANFYAVQGAKGGKAGKATGTVKGFATRCLNSSCPALKKFGAHPRGTCAGVKGGKISRRGKGRVYA